MSERGPASSGVFQAQDDDDDDVRWALSTAAAQWQRGGQADAIVWIRRAAESAEASGAPSRATELRASAAQLAESMWGAAEEDVIDAADIEIEVDVESSSGGPPPLPQYHSSYPPPGSKRPSAPQLEVAEMDLEQAVASVGGELMAEHEVAALLSESAPAPAALGNPFGASPDSANSPFASQSAHARATFAPEANEANDRPSSPLNAPAATYRRTQSSEPTLVASEDYATDLDAGVGSGSNLSSPPPDVDFRFPEESPEVLASIGPDSQYPSRGVPSVLPPAGLAPDSQDFVEDLDDANLEVLDDERATGEYQSDRSPVLGPPSERGAGGLSDIDDLIGEASIFPEELTEEDRPTGDWTSSVRPAAVGAALEKAPASQPLDDSSVSAEIAAIVPTIVVDGVSLDEASGFEDLPENVQQRLVACAQVETLEEGEEVGLFGAAIVTRGQVSVLPAFADEVGTSATEGTVVFTRGTLSESLDLRVVARADDTRVVVWRAQVLQECLADCPWVEDELRFIADRYLAFCGATLGPLGELLDSSLRDTVFQRLEVKTFDEGEELMTAGEPFPGLYIVAGGVVERVDSEGASSAFSSGAFVFASTMMTGGATPATVRAGSGGALVLFAPRSVAHELMVMVPPLLEAMAAS